MFYLAMIHECKQKKKFDCEYELYHFTAGIDGAPYELFEFANHSCETAEYHTGLNRKQREAMNLAMKMRQGLGKPSMFVREYLQAKNEGLPENTILVNAISRFGHAPSTPFSKRPTVFGNVVAPTRSKITFASILSPSKC